MQKFKLYITCNLGFSLIDGKKYKDITNEVDSDDESSEDEETKGKRTFDKLKRAGNSILSGNVTNMKAKDTEKSLRWNEQRVSLMKVNSWGSYRIVLCVFDIMIIVVTFIMVVIANR